MPRPRPLALVCSLAGSLVFALGCSASSLATVSAPELGCDADDITITDSRTPFEGPSSWTAICGEQRWLCSRFGDGQFGDRVICTEDPRPVATPSSD